MSTASDFLAFASALLVGGTRDGERVLSRPSVTLMTSDHLTPAQKAVSGFTRGYFDDIGWGFGMSVRTRRPHPGPPPGVSYPWAASVGSYGWPGVYGTGWYNDPCRGHDDNPHDPAGARATFAADLARLLDGRLPGDRRLTAAPETAESRGGIRQLAIGPYADVVVFSIRVSRPRWIAGRIWNFGQDLCTVFSLTLIVLRLVGVIAWSWWWVLAPLWISGILVAAVSCALLVLFCRELSMARGTSADHHFTG